MRLCIGCIHRVLPYGNLWIWDDPCQPLIDDRLSLRGKAVAAFEHMEFHVVGPHAQTLGEPLGGFRFVEFVLAACDVQEGCGDLLIGTVLPVSWHSAADADYAAHLAGMGGRKAIVHTHRLRESRQNTAGGGNAVLASGFI